jgi:hypothetical protein
LYVLTVLALLAAMEIGYRLAKANRRTSPGETDAGAGAMAAASLALLAFMLAFLVSLGTGFAAERRRLVVAEANAIGTANLRADYLDEPYRTESRDLFREYTNVRLAAVDLTQRPAAVARSEEIHDELWAIVKVIAVESPLPTIALYIDSVNEVIDRHPERLALGVDIRIPPILLLGAYVVALLTTFLVGVHSGYSEERSYLAQFVMVLILSLVLLLIVDLDRSHEGLIRVSQLPLMDLQRQLNAGQ